MAKKADLRTAMLSRAGRRGDVIALERHPPDDTDATRSTHFRPGRVGKANVTGYYPPEVKKQLRVMAAQGETTIQGLLAEALNDLFAKYGKPEIAPFD